MININDVVICISSNPQKTIKKGKIYNVFSKVIMPCGCVFLNVGVLGDYDGNKCLKHNTRKEVINNVLLFNVNRFKKLISNKDLQRILNERNVNLS